VHFDALLFGFCGRPSRMAKRQSEIYIWLGVALAALWSRRWVRTCMYCRSEGVQKARQQDLGVSRSSGCAYRPPVPLRPPELHYTCVRIFGTSAPPAVTVAP
jgi:hypothetical protein